MAGDGFAAWFVGYAQGGKGAVVMMNCNSLAIGFSLLRSVAQQYGWTDYIPTRAVTPVGEDTLLRLAGKYNLAGDIITFSTDSKNLYGQVNGGRKLSLLPSSPMTYFMNMDLFHELEVQFVERPNGTVNEVVFKYPYFSYKGLRIE